MVKERRVLRDDEEERFVSHHKSIGSREDDGFKSFAFRVPDGMDLFKFKKVGIYRLDVIPYVITNYPMVGDAGFMSYERTYYIHDKLGAQQKRVLCPLKSMHGEKCAVCDKGQQFSDWEARKPYSPRQRQLFYIIDLSPTERDKGVQLFETSYFAGGSLGFGQLLDAKLKGCDDDDPETRFASLTKGSTLKVTTIEGKFKGRPIFNVAAIDFVQRKEQYSKSFIKDLESLDDLLVITPYKEVMQLLEQGFSSGEEEKDVPVRSSKTTRTSGYARKEEEEENTDEVDDNDADVDSGDDSIQSGSTVRHKKLGVCTVLRVVDDIATLIDLKGKQHKNIPLDLLEEAEEEETEEDGSEEVEEEEETEEEEESEDVEEEETEEEEEEDERPQRRKTPPPKGSNGRRK